MRRCVLGGLVALLFCAAGSTLFGQNLAELRWDHKLEHFPRAEASAYDAWTISPPTRGSENPQDFGTIVEGIAHEANTSISYIFLGDLVQRPELQKAVIEYVTAQPEYQKHPPPRKGRWEFMKSGKLGVLVKEGLMHSPLVADCNAVLGKYDKVVGSVSMEEIFFTKKDGQWGWGAAAWLSIDAPPQDAPKKAAKK